MKKLILDCVQKAVSIMLTALLLLLTISFEVFAGDPKVSIIIPVHNTPENLLRDCLNSAKNQTLKDIEIICVDDGSTDGSGKILDEYANSDPRFVAIHQSNGGSCVARDKGMDLAKGEYIQFLDSDDTINPTASEKCYNAAKEYDADVVRFPTRHVNTDKIKIIDPNSIFYTGDISNIYTVVWGGIYRTKFLNNNKLRFNGLIQRGGEDLFFNCLCYPISNKIVILPEKLVNYTIRKDSLTRTHIGERINLCCYNIKYMNQIIKEKYRENCIAKLMFLECCLSLKNWCHGDLNPVIKSIDPELLQDDVINKLPIAEKIKLKSMLLIANSKTKPQKTLDDGIYTISSKLDPNKCLDIAGGSQNDKANLQLWQRNGTNAQKFKVQYNSDGYYTIKSMCSGKFIDVSASSRQNGTNIWQYSGNGTDAQKWFIIPDGEGYYCLVSRCNNLCMDVCGAKAINGTNIHCWDMHGGDNQRFKFEKCEDKPMSNKPSEVKKEAAKPRSNKPVKIKKNAGKPNSSKPGDSKKSA